MASAPSLGEAGTQSTTWTTLPPEVRIKIYRYLFIAEKSISFESSDDHPPTPPPDPPQLSSQLLRCNKVILAEAQPILYSNVFDIHVWDDIFRYSKHDRDVKGVFADETERAFWKSQLRHISMRDCSANCVDLIAQIRQMPHLQSIQLSLMGQYGWDSAKNLSAAGVDDFVQSHGLYSNWEVRALIQNFPNVDVYFCIHLVESKSIGKGMIKIVETMQGPILRYRMALAGPRDSNNTFDGAFTLDDHPIPTKNGPTYASAVESLLYAARHRRHTITRS